MNTIERAADGARELSAAEVGALAHLYRGEVYSSTIWRTRLDTTTNRAVVTLGVALSAHLREPGRLAPAARAGGFSGAVLPPAGNAPLSLLHEGWCATDRQPRGG